MSRSGPLLVLSRSGHASTAQGWGLTLCFLEGHCLGHPICFVADFEATYLKQKAETLHHGIIRIEAEAPQAAVSKKTAS